ncbi:unnamed protein product [Heligmosomoides polygyrus]|uniref:Endo/exonuclease/phosphatase domain-containing protein n=1 Tax=Heligmosomoides polygyrus TaxID=6339 RepID=A0A183GEG3_HELPZ|nr:unnamed protein product [Heligmosomoides polygyrus]
MWLRASFDCIRCVCPTSDYDDEEVEAFYVELEKFYKEDHISYKVVVGDFNAKIGPRSRRKNFTLDPRFGVERAR